MTDHPAPDSPTEPVPDLQPGPETASGADPLPVPVAAPEPDAGSAVAPTATVAPAPVPAPARGVGAPRKAASVGGQVVGVIGIVVCLALAVGVLLGRGWAVDQVDAVAAGIDAQLAKAAPLIDRVEGAVGNVTDVVGRVEQAASAVSEAANPAPALTEALSTRLGEVSERYLPLRAAYADTRETLVTALDRLETLDRIVPGIDVPDGPVDALRELDARVQAVDAGVMAVIDAGTGAREAVVGAASMIAEKAAEIEATLVQVESALAAADAQLEATRAQVASTAGTVSTAISIVSFLLILALLYVAFLHLVLFRSAGGARKSTPAP
ncbi:MAG TPA: hypothetical protein VFY23_04750 [Candidatus Limnocylindrales bacterium]|nr:hypothetical protein [Candidatus Limnocylindrales bacterium]